MPDLRIVTWNSTGEDQVKANELLNEINLRNQLAPLTPVNVVLHQEAQANAGGAIDQMLSNPGVGGIGGNFQRPAIHLREMPNNRGAGYTVLIDAGLRLQVNPRPHDYTADPMFGQWVAVDPVTGPRPAAIQQAIWQEATAWRPPVSCDLVIPNPWNRTVRLITWHAPIDLSGVFFVGYTTPPGNAPLDAFLFLEASALIQNVQGIDLVIIAGDLNLTPDKLRARYQNYEPLSDFGGESHHLDHVLAWRPAGPAASFPEAFYCRSSSVHDIFSCLVRWF